MLVEHAPGVLTVSAPLRFLGLHIGTRMTVITLPSGALAVHSPVPLDEALRATIAGRGEVAHIVAPNLYHHLYVGDWARAYPKARLHAPAALRAKRPDLPTFEPLERATPQAFEGALLPMHIDGSLLDETVFVHPSSRTIISSDLSENFEASDHLPTDISLRLSGIHRRIGLGRPLRLLYRDHAAARRSIDRLLAHDADRLIVAHGNVIEGEVRGALRETFSFLRP